MVPRVLDLERREVSRRVEESIRKIGSQELGIGGIETSPTSLLFLKPSCSGFDLRDGTESNHLQEFVRLGIKRIDILPYKDGGLVPTTVLLSAAGVTDQVLSMWKRSRERGKTGVETTGREKVKIG